MSEEPAYCDKLIRKALSRNGGVFTHLEGELLFIYETLADLSDSPADEALSGLQVLLGMKKSGELEAAVDGFLARVDQNLEARRHG